MKKIKAKDLKPGMRVSGHENGADYGNAPITIKSVRRLGNGLVELVGVGHEEYPADDIPEDGLYHVIG